MIGARLRNGLTGLQPIGLIQLGGGGAQVEICRASYAQADVTWNPKVP